MEFELVMYTQIQNGRHEVFYDIQCFPTDLNIIKGSRTVFEKCDLCLALFLNPFMPGDLHIRTVHRRINRLNNTCDTVVTNGLIINI